jgi:hypothetical protein
MRITHRLRFHYSGLSKKVEHMSDYLKRLKKAQHKVAQLVMTDRVYLPIYERLESEIIAHENQSDLVERARALVQRQRAIG